MLRWLKSLFAWEVARIQGVWVYSENLITGQRRAEQQFTGGYCPVDLDWLDAGTGHPIINGRPAWRSAEGQVSGRYC